jgi:receptor protein-tyrosine kinase
MNGNSQTNRSPTALEGAGVIRRCANALRRSRGLIFLIVLLLTAAAVGVSLILPKTYESTATIALDVTGSDETSLDAETAERRLATIKSLISSPNVDERAAEKLPGVAADEIHSSVSAAVDPEANLVEVTGSDRDPEVSADIANTVAQAFIEVETELEQRRLSSAVQNLQKQLNSVSRDPNAVTEVAMIRRKMSDLAVQEANAGADLQIVKPAEIPTSPASPRPIRNGILAFFAALFLGVLFALARDRLRPRITEPRELGRMTGWPVLAGIPDVRRRLRLRSLDSLIAEHEAYQTLAAAFQVAVPPGGGNKVILVTSAVHQEGKSTVTARLGQTLAQSGLKTLLVSADLRWPTLHEAFEVPLAPGLTEVTGLIERAGVSQYMLQATAHEIPLPEHGGRAPAELHLLTSGAATAGPSAMLASGSAAELFRYIRDFDYSYVLVDGPPVIGIADAQPLVQLVDGVLFVARLDQLKPENIGDIQELFARLGRTPIGSVAIGARLDKSPYYTERPSLVKSVWDS